MATTIPELLHACQRSTTAQPLLMLLTMLQ
jgi:hypothetical protein